MKIRAALLLFLVASAGSAKVDNRLFADYVRSVVACCSGKRVVVFYSGGEPLVFITFLKESEFKNAVTPVSLDAPSRKYRSLIKPHVTSSTVAVAYDLDPDAVRVLGEVAAKENAITISSTEEDVYTTSFSFDSAAPDRFRHTERIAGCNFENCRLTFHSEKVGPNTMARRAVKTFLSAHGKLEPHRKERARATPNEAARLLDDARKRAALIEVARLLQDALRHVPDENRLRFLDFVSQDRVLNGEWHDVYAPHYDLGEVFAYFANCEAAEIEWATSQKELKQKAPAVLKELEKIRKQNCS